MKIFKLTKNKAGKTLDDGAIITGRNGALRLTNSEWVKLYNQISSELHATVLLSGLTLNPPISHPVCDVDKPFLMAGCFNREAQTE